MPASTVSATSIAGSAETGWDRSQSISMMWL